MISNTTLQIDIKTSGGSDFVSTFTSYVPDGEEKNRPAVIIFSGGAYKVVSQYECAPTARKYAERGCVAFTVSYSCMPATFPQSLCEGMWVVKYVREHADEYGIDPNNVTAMGFSAGGHLVAAMGTLWNLPELSEYLGNDRRICRPDKMVLCYPVISNKGDYHKESFRNLLGGNGVKNQKLFSLMCMEENVTADTPPTFIWHGAADDCVRADGSLRFVSALLECGVHVEFHLYPFANHGGGLNLGQYHGDWSDKAEIFIKDTRINLCGRND